MPKTVVIFGATSYVGGFLVRKLLEGGTRVVAVTRDRVAARILLGDGVPGLDVCSAHEAAEACRRRRYRDVAAIVNFAFTRDAAPHQLYAQNARLTEAIDAVARASGGRRVVHVSTVAVFGYTLEARPVPEMVPMRYGDLYIESKIDAENRLLSLSSGGRYPLAIVRLGNVLGPGSGVWVAQVAQRILEGKAVAYSTGLGHSNSTYVENVADYLRFLIERSSDELATFGTFHHLGEFAGHSWREVVEVFSDVIGRRYLLCEPIGREGPEGGLSFVRHIVFPMLTTGAPAGYIRRMLGALPLRRVAESGVQRLRDIKFRSTPHTYDAAQVGIAPGQRNLLEVLSCPRLYESHLMSGWTPPCSFDGALAEMGAWLKDYGYSLSRPA